MRSNFENYILNIFVCILLIAGIAAFTFGCQTTNAQTGAIVGVLGGMAGSAIGKGDRKTTAITGAAGAALGYVIGNEMDKKTPRVTNTQAGTPGPVTDCRKVITRKTVNGQTTETIEEVCEGQMQERTY